MTQVKTFAASATLMLSLILSSCGTASPNPVLPGNSGNPPAGAPITLSSGTLAEITPVHPTSGTAKLIKTADGKTIARLEGFKTVSGPDLRVWISETSTLTSSALLSSVYTDLGVLSKLSGDVDYTLPTSVDASKIKSIVIWCEDANIAFGGAVLN
jgi:hypothetical protein